MENAYIAQASDLTAVANAIREKGETSEQLVFPDGFVAAIQAIEAGKPAAVMPTFTYSVSDGYETETNEETGEWKIRFLTSGVLVFTSEPPLIDVWMCGGGGGAAGPAGAGTATGGGGYVSGKLKCRLAMGEEYTITIGAGGKAGAASGNGGTGGTTSAFGLSAKGGSGGACASGKGGNGGSGGNASGTSVAGAIDGADGASTSSCAGGTGDHTTTREFFEADATLYCSGGASNKTAAGGNNTGDGGSRAKASSGTGTAGGSGIVILRGSAV